MSLPGSAKAAGSGSGSVEVAGPDVRSGPASASSGATSSAGRTWDEAHAEPAQELVRQYEEHWRRARPQARPDPFQFLRERVIQAEQGGARLALLRSDLSLRWEAGDRVAATWYFEREPELDDETRVALVYEEFCLAEEFGVRPNRQDYLRRHPRIAVQLERVFQIHGLMESVSTTAWHRTNEVAAELPEAGQTISGFHLIEELGRGAFARVFLAEERQLANRRVALKVSRRGSREPETLARLQHTHIVPIHFHRTDPATGLHLLCMPYFSSLTLARLLEHPVVQEARTGQEILNAIDELESGRVGKGPGSVPAPRRELASRPYVQAIAWWGARLAEALQHAHEHGILHRDVKPSNVLITSEGIPMLLDFNLAAVQVWEGEGAQAGLGGTLAYMAPEHLEALAGIQPERVGAEADLYALGVVLYETMGARAFDTPRIQGDPIELFMRLARERRAAPPRLRDAFPEVSPAFEVVVRKCLEPDPADRYATAGELAEDLQAVADDRPLRYAKEPWTSLAPRWIRGKRRVLIVAAAVCLAVGSMLLKSLTERLAYERSVTQARELINAGRDEEQTQPQTALVRYQAAEKIAEQYESMRLTFRESRSRIRAVEFTLKAQRDARRILREADGLRFAILETRANPRQVESKLNELFQPFFIREKVDWYSLPQIQLLGEEGRKVASTIGDLLFLESWYYLGCGAETGEAEWRRKVAATVGRVLAWQLTERARDGRDVRERAGDEEGGPGLRLELGPWRALESLARGESPRWGEEPQPGTVTDPQTCFYWALIHILPAGEDEQRQRVWLEQAIRLDPSRYWPQYYLGRLLDANDEDSAREHLFTAMVLRPDSPIANLALANFYRKHLIWKSALWYVDLAIKAAGAKGIALDEAYLNKGMILQRLGRHRQAAGYYRLLIERLPEKEPLARQARINLANLMWEQGNLRGAYEAFDQLAREAPEEIPALVGRATLGLQLGRLDVARADLTELVARLPEDAQFHSMLAECAFAREEITEAVEHARRAYGLQLTTRLMRLREQLECATGVAWMNEFSDPEDMDHWPLRDPYHRRHVLGAVEGLRRDEEGPTVEDAIRAAILLAGIREERSIQILDPWVERLPNDTRLRLARARVYRRFGKLPEALTDVERALQESPTDSQLILMQARLFLETGRREEGMQRFLQVPNQEQTHWSWSDQARGYMAVGDPSTALACWNNAVAMDAEDVAARLGRAAAFDRRRMHEQAAADLEFALGLAGNNRKELWDVAVAYARAAVRQPGRMPRASLAIRRWLESMRIIEELPPAQRGGKSDGREFNPARGVKPSSGRTGF